MKSLAALLPAIYTEADQNDGSLGVYVAAYDDLMSEIEEAIVDLKQITIPPLSTFAQDNATKYGNPFPFMTDARWQNQDTQDQLTTLYGMRGTQVGVAQAAMVLNKIPVVITQDLQYAWVLGVSILGGVD
jgi:hypothetical protein